MTKSVARAVLDALVGSVLCKAASLLVIVSYTAVYNLFDQFDLDSVHQSAVIVNMR